MAEDNQPAPTVTPASNQNLILGLVMGAVILLLLLLVISQQFNKQKPDKENEEVAALKKTLAEKQAKRLAPLVDNQNPMLLVESIKRDTDALAAFVSEHQANLARLRDSDQTIQNLSRQIGDLQRLNDQSRGAASRVVGLESQLAAARSDAQNLRTQLAGTVDQATVAALRDQLGQTKAQRNKLQDELDRLNGKVSKMVDRNQIAVIRAELDELRPENRRLKEEIQELRAKLDGARLFVSRERLNPRARALFKELERIEGDDHAARAQSYRRIEQDFKARVVETATFKTGSAAIDVEHEAHIKGVTVDSPGNAFFLVVGYASKKGDSKTNQQLSERRAKRMASVVNSLKQRGQEVQAVYLGETDRYGKQAGPNQVCEVWEIRP